MDSLVRWNDGCLCPFNPPWQRFDALYPRLHRRIRFELESAFRRNRDVRIAREIRDRRPAEREPVVLLQPPLEYRESVLAVTLVLLIAAGLDLVDDAASPLQAVMQLVIGQREPLRHFRHARGIGGQPFLATV